MCNLATVISSRSVEPSSYRIFLGIQNLNAEEPSLQIRSVHKLLKEPSGADIALLKLNRYCFQSEFSILCTLILKPGVI